jgi:2'-5' RNA ligase
MKTIILILCFTFSLFASGSEIQISGKIRDNSNLPFIERKGALAHNVEYGDIKVLRTEIENFIKKPLKFLLSWDKNGEAHVTTITPPEFKNQLSHYISEETMNQIAKRMNIQAADIKVLGIGSGKKKFGDETGETFFVIIQSARLLDIRKAIYAEYLKAGGPVKGFNPERFFPHITIGFTHEDIHETDGLLKDRPNSLDMRFQLKMIVP